MKKRHKFMANKNTLKCNKQNNIVTSLSINNGVQCFICDFLIYLV